MPGPLVFVPFLVKGAVIAAKAIGTKGALAKGTAMVVKTSTATFGTGATMTAGALALTAVGGIAWTMECVEKAEKAYTSFENGDTAAAIKHLTLLAASIKTVGTSSFDTDLKAWIAAGKPIDASLEKLVNQAQALAEEARSSAKLFDESNKE